MSCAAAARDMHRRFHTVVNVDGDGVYQPNDWTFAAVAADQLPDFGGVSAEQIARFIGGGWGHIRG